MSTQLPNFLIAEREPRPNTKFYEWYMRKKQGGREDFWAIYDYLRKHGPKSCFDMERDLVKSAKEKIVWYDEKGEAIKPDIEPTLRYRERIYRDLPNLVACQVLNKKGKKYSINMDRVYFVNTDFLQGEKYQKHLDKMKRDVRNTMKSCDFVRGVGTSLLFHNVHNRKLLEENARVQLALRIIEEGNKLLRNELKESEFSDQKVEYLFTANQHKDTLIFNQLNKGFQLRENTTDAMLPIIQAIDEAIKRMETRKLHLFSLNIKERRNLSNGPVNDAMRKAFEKHGQVLSDEAEVFQNTALEFGLLDDNAFFLIEDTGTELKVYQDNSEYVQNYFMQKTKQL